MAKIQPVTTNGLVGAVIIGRNEGRTLARAINSARNQVSGLVYVDSGSTDGSTDIADRIGAQTLELDNELKFTAARARNAGFRYLLDKCAPVQFVQFLDADAELVPGWAAAAAKFLREQPDVAAVSGRLRERFPQASVYNRLCDIEWDTPVGDTQECGGIALWRADVLLEAGGFREDLIAGEEPELCHRVRQLGWRVHKLELEMATHDAAMVSARQWWIRNRRSGYALAQAASERGKLDPSLRSKVASNILWSIPLFWPLWPVLWWKMFRMRGSAYATHIVVGKLPHLLGQISFWSDSIRGKSRSLIEHK